jgi:FlaA1/EpsC-like NDP-sugar epimerase
LEVSLIWRQMAVLWRLSRLCDREQSQDRPSAPQEAAFLSSGSPVRNAIVLPLRLLALRRPVIVALHFGLIPFGYLVAFLLRFDLRIPEPYWAVFLATVPLLMPVRLVAFAVFGLYRGWWRHVGMKDLIALLYAVSASTAGFLGLLFFTQQLDGFPRSVLILDWLVAIFLFGGARFCVRAIREKRSGMSGVERRGTPALIIGAGEAAERLLRQVWQGGTGLRPLGMVDDDRFKHGMRLHGVPILGSTEDLPRLLRQYDAKLVVIAIPSASREAMKRLVDLCMGTGVEFKIVPPLLELLDGRSRVSQLRSVELEDLLGRDAIKLDLEKVRRDIEGRVVLITGAAGSIGSELVRQIAAFHPSKLVLLEQAESPLYFVDLETRRHYPDLEVVPVVADVADQPRLDQVFAHHRPDCVFHAAAYKHVPLMEGNVVEAVRNNVFGTLYVGECAARYGTRKFVLISTDKAVRPSSVMGATKRVAERIVLGALARSATGTDFRAVRFGNVLGSDGSVIPLFRKQLARGGPLTVTHPDVTRYFMTIPEAVQLVLQAAAVPEAAGHISMLEMGEPVRLVELAENLIRLSGLEPYRDVPIVFSGLRPGEKLFEELMSEVEATVSTEVEKVRVVQTDETNGDALSQGVDRLAAAVAVGDEPELLAALCALVPDCVEPLRSAARAERVEGRSEFRLTSSAISA